jgi:hypothetical protein
MISCADPAAHLFHKEIDMQPTEQDNENSPTTRAGGDVITKSASQAPQPEKRASGDVITKGASQTDEDADPHATSDPETRAGGDVITKGASKD